MSQEKTKLEKGWNILNNLNPNFARKEKKSYWKNTIKAKGNAFSCEPKFQILSNDQFILSNADFQVKSLISGYLEEISPEDRKTLNWWANIKKQNEKDNHFLKIRGHSKGPLKKEGNPKTKRSNPKLVAYADTLKVPMGNRLNASFEHKVNSLEPFKPMSTFDKKKSYHLNKDIESEGDKSEHPRDTSLEFSPKNKKENEEKGEGLEDLWGSKFKTENMKKQKSMGKNTEIISDVITIPLSKPSAQSNNVINNSSYKSYNSKKKKQLRNENRSKTFKCKNVNKRRSLCKALCSIPVTNIEMNNDNTYTNLFEKSKDNSIIEIDEEHIDVKTKENDKNKEEEREIEKKYDIQNLNGLSEKTHFTLNKLCNELKENVMGVRDSNILCEEGLTLDLNGNDKLDKEEKDVNDNHKAKLNSSSNLCTEVPSTFKNERYRRLSKNGLVYDSYDDEEAEEETNDYLYLDETSFFIKVYDFLFILSGVYTWYITPLILAYSHDLHVNCPLWRLSLEILIDFWNISDIFISLFKSYLNFEEIQITKLHYIMIHYLTGWFFLDLLAGIPFNSIYAMQSYKAYFRSYSIWSQYYNASTKSFNYFFCYFRIWKSFKIFLKNQILNSISWVLMEWTHFMNWSKAYTSLALFLTSVHFLTCLFIFIGQIEYPNWISSLNWETSEFGNIYVASIYYNLATIFSVGYGDVISSNHSERFFNCFLWLFGISIYSWTLSSISTYIQIKQSKDNEFKIKIAILEELKRTFKKMPYDWYDKIVRFLKYKFKNEKKDKNVIFECLPIGLRNNLIVEMYKPVINNFVFFKNFPNPDFIIRVILAFRPTINIKNDILVTDGDFVSDMFFVKKGKWTLDVPLPIVCTNNVTKSYNGDTCISKGNHQIQLAKTKGTLTQTYLYWCQDSTIQKSLIGGWVANKTDDWNYTHWTKTQTKLNILEQAKKYIKILEIRKNEHFGDVLMFLNKPSPWRVKVKTKICEMFEWNKTDAIEISTSYPEIWRIINKKSVFNMEQIERLINKALKIFFVSNEGEQIRWKTETNVDNNEDYQMDPQNKIENIIRNESICELRSIPTNNSIIMEEESGCYESDSNEDKSNDVSMEENDNIGDKGQESVTNIKKKESKLNTSYETVTHKNVSSPGAEITSWRKEDNNNNKLQNIKDLCEKTTIKTNIENKEFDNNSLFSVQEDSLSNPSRVNNLHSIRESYVHQYVFEEDEINAEIYPNEKFHINFNQKEGGINLGEKSKYDSNKYKNSQETVTNFLELINNFKLSTLNPSQHPKLELSKVQRELFTIESKYENIYLLNNFDIHKTKDDINLIKDKKNNPQLDIQITDNPSPEYNSNNINGNIVRSPHNHMLNNSPELSVISRQDNTNMCLSSLMSRKKIQPGAVINSITTMNWPLSPTHNKSYLKKKSWIDINGSSSKSFCKSPQIRRRKTLNSNPITWIQTLDVDEDKLLEKKGSIFSKGNQQKTGTPLWQKKNTVNLVSENIQKNHMNLKDPQLFYMDYFQSLIKERNKKKEIGTLFNKSEKQPEEPGQWGGGNDNHKNT